MFFKAMHGKWCKQFVYGNLCMCCENSYLRVCMYVCMHVRVTASKKTSFLIHSKRLKYSLKQFVYLKLLFFVCPKSNFFPLATYVCLFIFYIVSI